MMSLNDIENNDRPATPLKEDCCGNSCNPCIFDVHKKLLEEWEKKKLNRASISYVDNFLSPTQYRKIIVKEITKACEDCVFILFECELDKNVLLLSPTQYVIIKLGSISKPYTPIYWNQKNVKLLIKLYPNGKTSCYIKQLQIGDEVYVRGPYGDFQYQRNSYKYIIMLSIGSGIAALYPLAVSIVKDELDDTRIIMFSGFHSLLHVPLKTELRQLTDFWNFECTLCLSQENTESITGIKIVQSQLNEQMITEILNFYSCETALILICGTSEFNNSMEKIIIENKFSHYYIFQ